MVILRKKVHFSLTDFIRTATPWGPSVPSQLRPTILLRADSESIFRHSAHKHKHTRTLVTRNSSKYININYYKNDFEV